MYSVMLTVSVTLTLRLRGLRSVLPHLGQGTRFSDGTSSESSRNIPHAPHWTMSSLSFAVLLPSGSLQHEEEYQLNWGGEPILVSKLRKREGAMSRAFFQDKERVGILASLSFRRAARRTRYIERGATEPNMAVKVGGEAFWAVDMSDVGCCH
jgi:hypothetical protein